MASRDLKLCVPELQTKIPYIIDDYNCMFPGKSLEVICTLRSTEEQQHLYQIGRSIPPLGPQYVVTTVDGMFKFSKHNPDPKEPLAKAVDFGVFAGGKYLTAKQYYYPLLDLSRKYKLISGIDFRGSTLPLETLLQRPGFKDFPHVEIQGLLYSNI